MSPHILMLARQYDLTLICSGDARDDLQMPDYLRPYIHFISVKFSRKIAIWDDICGLVALYRIFRSGRFDVVHSLMPKTGLLTMLAGRLTGVPHRVHMFTGQVWANKFGIRRSILKLMDRIISFCATDLLTDSFSQRSFLIDQNIVQPHRILVLANGSVCGVDVGRFKFNAQIRGELRSQLNIPQDAVVFIFLGRINREKGVPDLVRAFVAMHRQFPNSHLVIVGPDENGLDQELREIAASCASCYSRIGYTERPEDYLSCADIFCLPSYREGFGSVIIEAACVGLPAVASRIYGVVDAVIDGETGILHEPGNIRQIQEKFLLLANSPELRQSMSEAAMHRAQAMFNQNCVTEAMRNFYQRMLG